MSERRADDAAPCSPEFSELWRTVSKRSKIQDKNKTKQMSATAASPQRKDFQSPSCKGFSKFPGLITGDSPGDGEASQDIFWDSTSPPQATTGSGQKNTRVVEISDIVNRIAPKDVKPKGTDSPLLQWIGDSAIPCTPEIPKPRARKKSSRHSSVEDLMKLARQFDENMQQEKELNSVNSNLSEYMVTSKINPAQSAFPGNVKDPECPPSSDNVEAELHALFDSSTQKVSGRLSQSSVISACSQEIEKQPVTPAVAEGHGSNLKSTASAVHPAEERGPCDSSAKKCDDFDDDWENDDLLNDSFVLAMTQNASEQHDTDDTKTITTRLVCEPTLNTKSTLKPSNSNCKPIGNAVQELCPKPKTTNRSTFKLEPNPHFQHKTNKEVSKSSFSGIQPKSQMFDQRPVTTKTPSTPQPDNVSNDHRVSCSGEGSVKVISDILWDDGNDDALLYQVCDSIERISNSQPLQVSPSNWQGKQDAPAEKQKRKSSNPLPIDPAWSASANRQSPRAFVRSNSLPETSCETVNYQGWNVPMKGANNKSWMSQSFPGSHMSLGTFNQHRDSSGTFQAGNANVDMKPHTVTARALQSSKTSHTAFKRNVSDSAAISNKVFVTSQMTSKCSAAEIERKKQEALARRRLRMQNASKP